MSLVDDLTIWHDSDTVVILLIQQKVEALIICYLHEIILVCCAVSG